MAHTDTQAHPLPADDDAVVEQVHLDVLDPDGLVEALGHEQAEQTAQVGGVVQRHTHTLPETLQQGAQHGPGVGLAWTHTHPPKDYTRNMILVQTFIVIGSRQEARPLDPRV